jgi:hypothetical protein
MVVPWQVLTDGNTQIFSFRCYVQFLPMDEVRWWYALTLGGYGYNFTLSGLKCICQSRSQYCKLLRSSWRDVVSSLVLMCRYRRQSSANNLAVLFTLLGRSLMYIKYSSGPGTVPWGTPEVTGAVSDATPSTITLWVRPVRKLLIQFKVGPRTP